MPLISGALELAAQGLLTSGDKTNRLYVGDDVHIAEAVAPALASLLFDPQTAGGLLISIPTARADELLAHLRTRYKDAALIGHARARGPHAIVVR